MSYQRNEVAPFNAKSDVGFITTSGWDKSLGPLCQNGIDVEALLRISAACFAKNKALLKCDKNSIYTAITECAALGMLPILGRAYFVPYLEKCTLMLGYQGLIELGRRNGVIAQAFPVFKGETFEWTTGLTENIVHVPNIDVDRTEANLRAVYCVYSIDGGEKHFDVMNKKEVDVRRQKSKTGGAVWNEFYVEMAKKTVIRRAAKYWPLAVNECALIERDDKRCFNFTGRESSQKTAISASELLENRIAERKKDAPKTLEVEPVEQAAPQKVDAPNDGESKTAAFVQAISRARTIDEVNALQENIGMSWQYGELSEADCRTLDSLIENKIKTIEGR